MDSDDSQDVSSGNESEVEQVNKKKRESRNTKRSSSRESVSSGKSSSRSRSNSSNRHSYKSSDSSPQSPIENEPESPGRPRTPKSLASGDELPEERVDALGPLSPDNVSLQNPSSVLSANSSRSNSPSPGRQIENGIKSPVSNSRDHLSSPNSDDSRSIKSDSSHNSRKSKLSSGNSSEGSNKSKLSRNGRKAANLEDGNSSDSSISSTELKHKNENNQADEISDGEIDLSENEKRQTEKVKEPTGNINISHEDLSDVSDLDSNDASDFDAPIASPVNTALDQGDSKNKKTIERTNINEVVEEQLDFEAEDGECAEPEVIKEDKSNEPEAGELEDDTKKVEQVPEELEEGELTDEDEARPEETEPRPVCRFFSRGQCTWGASCRFLHPGVTDKGNYTMFELVRPVVPGDYGNERLMYNRAEPPQVESAWERGLRTAKEMMRKSIKRKEQDIDFEEKKMNLSLAQEELDKENGYYAKAPSPEPSRYMPIRHPAPIDYAPPVRVPPEEYYGRRQVIYEPEYPPAVPRERFRTYRDVQPHRSAEYYNSSNKHEEEAIIHKAKKPKREVIVQRVEERAGRGDEWSDPWMRSKSPAGRKRRRKHSYSSGSSYSSSSSSRSSSASSRSSYRSQSRSSHKKRSPRTHKRQVSPSVIVSERKAANERAALMNPPAPRKRAPSPGMMRVGAQNPPAPSKVDQFGRTRSKLAVAAALARVKGRKRTSRSSSGSTTGSSSSDSDSSGSSSSSSRNVSPTNRRPSGVDLAIALKAKAIDALKSGSEKKQIKLNLKNNSAPKKSDLIEMARKGEVGPSRKRLASPPVDPKNASANKKASSRREELLKQLKAVEDAIAKKRSKV